MTSASPRPIRVLFVVPDLGSGGTERQLVALTRRLPRDRFTAAFVLIRERGMHADLVEAEGIEVTVLGILPPSQVGWIRVLPLSIRGLYRFLRTARRGRYDIVDAWLYHGYWLAAVTHRLAGIRLFVAGRRSLSDFKEGWGWPARALDGLARRRAHVVVANSELVRCDVIEREGMDPRRIVVIPNGVEVLPEPDTACRQAARRQWGISDDDFVIGCVSNLKQGKGIEDLLEAFALLADRDPVRLVLVGDGPRRAQLMDQAERLAVSDRVRFHGLDADPSRLLPGMDLFVHPSESEGLPNAVLEAAAAGLPIVATAAGGTPEIVSDGETGALVPVGDVAAMASAIEALRGDPDRRTRLGAAARHHVRATYGMDRFIAETAALYERLVAGPPPGQRSR